MSYGLWIVASACGLLAMTFIPNDAHSGFISFLPSTEPKSSENETNLSPSETKRFAALAVSL